MLIMGYKKNMYKLFTSIILTRGFRIALYFCNIFSMFAL